MIAHAPGKLLLSGAYVVLDGASAVVAAIDRYAVADAGRLAAFLSDELRAAFPGKGAPHVDVSAMRTEGRKLGVGSSAAALVAALAAREIASGRALDDEARLAIAREAFDAHRAAQGGGSGVDVVACALGGVQLCRRSGDGLPSAQLVRIPPGLAIEAWICPGSASTPLLLSRVRSLRTYDPGRYEAVTWPARTGADRAAQGFVDGDRAAVIEGAAQQLAAMLALDEASGAPIVPSYLRPLGPLAAREGAVFAPSGAGGGDVALYFGEGPSSPALRAAAARAGLAQLPVRFGAPGVAAGPPPA